MSNCKYFANLIIYSAQNHQKIQRNWRNFCALGKAENILLDASGLRALRQRCITHRHDSVVDITKWAQEYFQKTLSVNTIRMPSADAN